MKTKSFVFTLLCCLLVGVSVKVFAAVTKEDRNVGSFTKVSVSSGIDLHLTQGSSHSVVIETEEDIINKIETVVENGTLIIKVKKGERISWNGKITLKAHVTTPVVDAIRGSGGSDIYLQTPISSNGSLEVALSGGSDLKSGSLKAKDMNVKLSGGSDAKQLDITADTFTGNFSGGSDCSGTITAPTIELKQSGGSDSNLTVNATTLNIVTSGGSDVSLSGRTHTITAKASGSSDIKANGLTYEQSDISKSGGSDIYLKK